VSEGLKAIHDRLMADKPDGATHDPATCPLCAMDAVDTGGTTAHDHPKGGSSVTTYSQEQLDAAVQEAVTKATAPLQTQLAELQGQTAEQQQQAAVDQAVAEKVAELAELQTKLDAATLEAATEKKAREDLEAFLENAKAEATAKAEADARKDARIEEVKAAELAFSDEWLDANADRLAAMSDEDWTAQLDSWKVLANKASDEIPTTTSLQAAREGAGDAGGGANKSKGFAVTGLRELRQSRALDPRTL
jgi:hypothetical protein